VHLISRQDYQRRIIWDVIGTVKGSELPEERVVVGNHRDAWVYGAVDPSSGTAAMLESVHGIGALLKQGWRPKRTIVFCSWDAEEEGLIGSTEWVEQQGKSLDNAVAYFNVDVAVSGPDFSAAAVPSLKQFVREVARSVPSPISGTVYQQWRSEPRKSERRLSNAPPDEGDEVHVGDLGSGSDFTPFLQHAGVPSTDIGSEGPYGVYHSTFDDYAWYVQNADPHFEYLQEMARVLGLEAVRMADADVLPLDYTVYAREITAYINAAKQKSKDAELGGLDFAPADAAAARLTTAAERAHEREIAASGDLGKLNHALRETETALLTDIGLPNRPWYKHEIYAPGEFTGYAAVVIPGVNEAIDAKNLPLAAQQLAVLAQTLDRAAHTLEGAR
jgi:N-acetylated-alpha-linked acidic dipeptidase